MDHPYGEQYGQEGNPRAYMTMRDYRNLPYQWGNQQPVRRNPNPPRSMREYRDQWMSAPVYSVPSTYPPPPQYDYPEPPFYASTPQSPQPLQSIHPLEQAMLDLTRIVDDFVEENKKIKAHSIVTMEDNLNKKIGGLKDDFEHKWDNLQDSIEDLIDQQQCPPEEECQSGTRVEEQRVVTVQANQETETVESSLNNELDGFQSKIDQNLDILQESISKLAQQPDQEEENLEAECSTETILVEQAQLQPQEELKMESVEAPEELQDTPESGDTFWPWKKEEQTSALISEEDSQEEECLSDTMVEEQCQQHLLLEPSDIAATVCPWENHTALLSEESSGHETGEEPQEPIFQPIPMKMNPSATAQPKNNPTANAKTTYSPLPVYILPTPAENPKPATPAPKAKSNPLPAAPPDSVFILPMPAAQPKPQASTTKATPSLLVLQNIRRLVASVHTFATTSKKMANAYIAWHSGWYWCGFGFGASEPRHF